MSCENDGESDDVENFVILSTNKNIINDVDEDFTEDSKFLLISSTGAAADRPCGSLGLYRQSEVERNVYFQEEEEEEDPDAWYYKLFYDQGVWVVICQKESMYLRAATPSESPTSVKWQYYDRDQNLWQDDQTLRVTRLNEKPTCECEVTIRLSALASIDIKDPGVSGEYRPTGTYLGGRPVMKHSKGPFMLYVSGGRWRVKDSNGNEGEYLCSRTVPSSCPADPRAAIDETRGFKYWGYMSRRGRGTVDELGVRVFL